MVGIYVILDSGYLPLAKNVIKVDISTCGTLHSLRLHLAVAEVFLRM